MNYFTRCIFLRAFKSAYKKSQKIPEPKICYFAQIQDGHQQMKYGYISPICGLSHENPILRFSGWALTLPIRGTCPVGNCHEAFTCPG